MHPRIYLSLDQFNKLMSKACEIDKDVHELLNCQIEFYINESYSESDEQKI